MLIYEVNLTVSRDIASDYRRWLQIHIEEMLKNPGFQAAKFYQRDADEAGGDGECWTVHYFVESRAALNDYFDGPAGEMREQGIRRFGGKFSANRRVLEPLEKFVADDVN
ncbi:DUF4286 family protein [bacterium SCSIO 12696]|nr:DUF4286 family protein [bacterium SCSIO 12696]